MLIVIIWLAFIVEISYICIGLLVIKSEVWIIVILDNTTGIFIAKLSLS